VYDTQFKRVVMQPNAQVQWTYIFLSMFVT